MVKRISIYTAFICLVRFAAASGQGLPITNLGILTKAVEKPDSQGRTFVLKEVVISATTTEFSDRMAVADPSGYLSITDGMFWPKTPFQSGDRIRMTGIIVRQNNDLYNYAKATNVVILSHGAAPLPVDATAAEINAGKVLDRLVRTEGRVIDVFRDEIDPRYVFFVLGSAQGFVYGIATDIAFDGNRLFGMLDSVIRVTGLCTRSRPKATGRLIDISVEIKTPDAITLISPPPADPFEAPMFTGHIREIQQIPGSGTFRRKVRGTVIAVWNGNSALVKGEGRTISRIGFANGPLPAYGDFIEAVGAPETDLHNLNLSRAIWRAADGEVTPKPQVESVPIKTLFSDKFGNTAINQQFHGRLLKFIGKVRSLPSIGNEHLTLDCDGYSLPVDFSAAPNALNGIEIGCEIGITGTCVMETENWRPQLPFPQIKGFFLVVRTVDDVRILSRPSWWTPSRLLLVIVALLAALMVFIAWNRILQRIVERRSRQLYREQIARERSELQTEERTRLAVELHDTIAQNLTGASFEINAAERLVPTDANASLGHLGRAARTLKSCRDELRNCIWDLRNRALEAPDMNAAIRCTLEPHIGETSLSVRFNVPRSLFTDNSAHALMRIIRELTLNAIRHGKAKSVKIAGSVENGVLRFSVRDDGSGFDPDNCPGLRDGHFGLQGVRERIKKFNGEMSIESRSGTGTRIALSFVLHSGGNARI